MRKGKGIVSSSNLSALEQSLNQIGKTSAMVRN